MKKRNGLEPRQQQIVFTSAFELLADSAQKSRSLSNRPIRHDPNEDNYFPPRANFEIGYRPAITDLSFPFALKPDQVKAVEAWMSNRCRGSVIYGSGTGKTEIAFECARRSADLNFGRANRHFNVLLLVPRKVLIQQNYDRLVRYRVSPEKLGRYFGEEKQINEIMIATYHSTLANLGIVRRADMVIFDEVHLARGAFGRIFDSINNEKRNKALLGLTATIDENDPRNAAILSLLPPVRKYLIKDAVLDKRLARPIILPISVSLTEKEQALHDEYSTKIRNISRRFNRYDVNEMMALMKEKDGFPRWQARAWFLNVKKRKRLLASAEKKLAAAVNLIAQYRGEKVMVFSETLESVRKLRQLLRANGIDSALIETNTPGYRRQKILSEWGKRFYALLSVHTLEIGYDVPEARIEIILAITSNMNQIVQRIGRVLRKVDGKDSALVYLVYVSDTKEDNTLALVRRAVETSGGAENKI
jgi:superfamily II DNA or RNA helicase